MKISRRFPLGLFLGTIGGAVVAGICLNVPAVRQTIGVYASDFEVAFGRSIGEHFFTAVTIVSALAGAAVGGSLAVSKRGFAVSLALMVGIAVGGATLFFVEVKVVKYVSARWEQGYADERASTYIQCLKAIDRGTTNQLYLVRFQNNARMALTNYVREMEKMEAGEHGGFSGTNAVWYEMARKYLATHTNNLSIGSDF